MCAKNRVEAPEIGVPSVTLLSLPRDWSYLVPGHWTLPAGRCFC